MNIEKKPVWRCTTCGSDDVAFDAWYYPNTDETQSFDDAYCMSCEGECSVEEHEEDVEP